MTAFRTPPTGAHHDVGPEESFFSTTDGKGVILQSNDVFVRLSRYPRERLIGAPHNIIRRPAMPACAFLLMWDTLTAGRPFCAYVDNLAADGSCYTVFATITPLGERYLLGSVPAAVHRPAGCGAQPVRGGAAWGTRAARSRIERARGGGTRVGSTGISSRSGGVPQLRRVHLGGAARRGHRSRSSRGGLPDADR
ncbi:hypothetical protein [Propioniciclava flava]